MYLSDVDAARVEKLAQIVRRLAPGCYALSDICGDDWPLMEDANSFSRKFRRIVEANMIPNLSLHPEKAKNDTLVYVVKIDETC